jgi:hypothetical protein
VLLCQPGRHTNPTTLSTTPIQSKSTLQSNNAANIINQSSSLSCGKQIQFKNKRIATPWQKGKVQTGVGVTDLLGVVASDKSHEKAVLFVCLHVCFANSCAH